MTASRLFYLLVTMVTIWFVYGFGPKKLYTLNLPTAAITSIKIVDRQIFFVGPWYISVIDNVQWKFMQKARMSPRIINKDVADPRIVGKIPTGTFKGDKRPYFWFTTYGINETSGGVYIMQLTNDYSQSVDISIDSGWNYEKVQWVDMNRDGLKDCLTARFRGGIGQMLWFQQPPGQQIWGQKIIHEGMADGNFLGFIYDRKSYIIIAGNQFSTLGLYWTMNPRNDWKFSRQVRFRVVDNYGRYYDVQYVDLDNDGRRDILTTTVQISSSRGHVLGYEIPYDIQNANWKRHVLAAGFNGDYAPGKAIAYWPNKYKQKTDRPSIFLSGAGEERLFILTPQPKRSGWGYIKSALQVGTGMVGIPFITDLNDDSYPEFFVPQGNQVHVFSYDYSTSALEPKQPKQTSSRSSSKRRQFPYRNPFFRPTTPAPSPAIPKGASPVALELGASQEPPLLPSNKETQNNSPPRIAKPPSNSGDTRVPAFAQPQFPKASQNLQSPIQKFPTNNKPNSQPKPTNPPIPESYIFANGQWYIPYNSPEEPVNNSANVSEEYGKSTLPSKIVIPSFVNGSKSQQLIPVEPENYVLSITSNSYTFQSEAADACGFEKKVLCSLDQLLFAVGVGKQVPDFDWGWFEISDRAAKINNCSPGEVKYDGYVCVNGIVEHLPVRQQTSLRGLCCSVINWATVTNRKYSRAYEAENECEEDNRRLCTISEMMKVWEESSYKGFQWGWFRSQRQLIRMSHYCDSSQPLWPGYECVENKLEIAEIQSNVQERGFCCPSAGTRTKFSFGTMITLITLFFIKYI